jgi:hypothetical protein
VPTILPRRYDAFLFLDETRALRPLHDVRARGDGEPGDLSLGPVAGPALPRATYIFDFPSYFFV